MIISVFPLIILVIFNMAPVPILRTMIPEYMEPAEILSLKVMVIGDVTDTFIALFLGLVEVTVAHDNCLIETDEGKTLFTL